jgi:hypothetical protein
LHKDKRKVTGQDLSTLTHSSGALTMSRATIQSALGLWAQQDQGKEEELVRKASSKAARQAAKVKKVALQAVAAEKKSVDKERRRREKEEKEEKGEGGEGRRRRREKEEKAEKLAQRKRERESQGCCNTINEGGSDD